ncbi:MAG: hypothetical protein WB558_03050 [Terriglobales bacterium]
MKYTKPEVAVLGEAVRVIEKFPNTKGITGQPDLLKSPVPNPAYDLDE